MPDPTPPTSTPLDEMREKLLGVLYDGSEGLLAEFEAAARAAGRAELEGALRDALALAVSWRDVSDDTLGRLTSGGSADLDFMGDEMDRLRALLSEGAKDA